MTPSLCAVIGIWTVSAFLLLGGAAAGSLLMAAIGTAGMAGAMIVAGVTR